MGRINKVVKYHLEDFVSSCSKKRFKKAEEMIKKFYSDVYRFCPECGCKLENVGKFCHACGNKLIE